MNFVLNQNDDLLITTFMKNSYLFLALLFSTGKVFAQNDSTAKILDEVVVTGQHKPQSLKNSVYKVNIINRQRIALSGATNIQQVLFNQLGLNFSNDNTLGTADIQMIGMSGRNVKILLDGVPLVDRGDTRESLNQVDLNSIDRIELVEGPMSVSYGSDALAGVVNLISKRPSTGGFSVFAKAQEETAGNEYYPLNYKGVHTQSLNLGGSAGIWNFALGGSHNEFDGFGGDGFGRGKSWRPKEQWLGNGRIGIRLKQLDLYYKLDGLHEDISNRMAMNPNTYEAISQYYISKRYLHQLQNNWTIRNNLQLNSILAYTDYSRHTKTIKHQFADGTNSLSNEPGSQDKSTFNNFTFRNLLNYQCSPGISFQPGVEITREKATGARINGTPGITDMAFFISSEIKPTKSINLRPGLRFIKNSVYDAPPVIPSVNTKFSLNNNFDLRLAYAYGFRSPALRELYFNFVDANHIIVGNPHLKAEHSNSFNGSLSYTLPNLKDGYQNVISLSGFYNSFNNLINYANSPTSTDTTITVNIDKYKTTGFIIEDKLKSKNLVASIGFSYIGRYNLLADATAFKADHLPQFMWTPEINANLFYAFSKVGTTVALFYKFSGKKPGYEAVMNNSTGAQEIHVTHIEGCHIADFTVNQKLFSQFNLSAGIKNIFNVTQLTNTSTNPDGVHNTGSAIPMSYGRSYFIGLTFHWSTKQSSKK